jgi:hypothetical protein
MFGTKGITDVLLLLRSYTYICKAHPPIETHKGIKGVSCLLKGRKRYGTDLPETVALLVDVASSSVLNSIYTTFDAGVLDAIDISLK